LETIQTIVGPDGTIQISAPELTPGQRVTVTIEAADTTLTEKRHAIDILAEIPGHRLFKTAEEVDAYIREERDSWDR
jgi:hypothetical protein